MYFLYFFKKTNVTIAFKVAFANTDDDTTCALATQKNPLEVERRVFSSSLQTYTLFPL